MPLAHNETVEVCKKPDGFASSYCTATVLTAIGRTKYLVQSETRFSEDRTRLLTEPVEESDIRPLPPPNLEVAEKVDAYINDGWFVGKIVRKVEPNYYVKLDSTGNVVHRPLYKVRNSSGMGRWKDNFGDNCKVSRCDFRLASGLDFSSSMGDYFESFFYPGLKMAMIKQKQGSRKARPDSITKNFIL